MAFAPNRIDVVRRMARQHPVAFRECHRAGLSRARQLAFVQIVAWDLWQNVSTRFGLNGKRGNVNDPSLDAIAYTTPDGSGAAGVEIIDIVAGAGGNGATPAWQDVTQETIQKGDIGVWVQPRQPSETPSPVPIPPPAPPPIRSFDHNWYRSRLLALDVVMHEELFRGFVVGTWMDWEGISLRMFQMREAGWNLDQVRAAIQDSDEWRAKH
jgi:hypothetical protein